MTENNTLKQIEETCSTIEAAINESLKALNEAVAKGDENEIKSAEATLSQHESDFAKETRRLVYTSLKHTESPMIEAMKMHTYTVWKHRAIRQEGDIVGFEKVFKIVSISPVDFAEFCGLDASFKYDIQKLAQRLTLKIGSEIGITSAETLAIRKQFNMAQKAYEIAFDKDPTSNNQVVKHIQSIIDKIIFVEGDNKKNIYRANNYDMKYAVNAFAKKSSKGTSALAVANHQMLYVIIGDICHRMVSGVDSNYVIEYKKLSDEKAKRIQSALFAKASPKTVSNEESEKKETTEKKSTKKTSKKSKKVSDVPTNEDISENITEEVPAYNDEESAA